MTRRHERGARRPDLRGPGSAETAASRWGRRSARTAARHRLCKVRRKHSRSRPQLPCLPSTSRSRFRYPARCWRGVPERRKASRTDRTFRPSMRRRRRMAKTTAGSSGRLRQPTHWPGRPAWREQVVRLHRRIISIAPSRCGTRAALASPDPHAASGGVVYRQARVSFSAVVDSAAITGLPARAATALGSTAFDEADTRPVVSGTPPRATSTTSNRHAEVGAVGPSSIDRHEAVDAFVKNAGLGFATPLPAQGRAARLHPGPRHPTAGLAEAET